MKPLLTSEHIQTLTKNGRAQRRAALNNEHLDFKPVIKLFTPDAQATWLLTEIEPDIPDLAFGLCDLGLGSPELGRVSITELIELRGPLGLPVECDLHFHPDKTLLEYHEQALIHSQIIA